MSQEIFDAFYDEKYNLATSLITNYANSNLFLEFGGLPVNRQIMMSIVGGKLKNQTVTDVSFESTEIGEDPELSKLLNFLLFVDQKLYVLNLSVCRITDNWLFSMLTDINGDCSLQKLDLNDNRIDDNGAVRLAQFLIDNPNLSYLDLSNNYIGKAGGKAIANALLNNNTLQTLYLLGNHMKTGADHFAKVLQTNTSLKKLNLDNTGIEDYTEFAKMITVNTTLKYLTIINDVNQENEDDQDHINIRNANNLITKSLNYNHTLTDFSFTGSRDENYPKIIANSHNNKIKKQTLQNICRNILQTKK